MVLGGRRQDGLQVVFGFYPTRYYKGDLEAYHLAESTHGSISNLMIVYLFRG